GADFLTSLLQEALDACAAFTRRVKHLEHDKVAQDLEITKLKTRVKKLERANKVKALKLRRLKKVGTSQRIESSTNTDVEDASNQGRMIAKLDRDTCVALMDDEGTEKKAKDAQEVVDVVTTAKLITEVVTAASESVTATSTTISAAEPQVSTAAITTAAPVMKKRNQTEAQARRNMIMYLKNVAGFRLDYFKGMSYDDIRLIFKAKFNSNIKFLLKSTEQKEEEENRAIESINETPAQKAAKRRKLNKEDEDLKQHLEIVPDEDDDSIVKERFSISKPNNFSVDYLLTTLRAMFERPADFASRKKIPTLEVYTRSNAKCNETESGRGDKAYIILKKHTRKLDESLNVLFYETPPPSKTSPLEYDDLDEVEEIKVTKKKNLKNDIEDETLGIDEIVNIKVSSNHPLEIVIGNLNQKTLRSQA
nr:hypothetical protein [Tanacetum cinerariifolium]